MKISLYYGRSAPRCSIALLGILLKGEELVFPKWPGALKEAFLATPGAREFRAKKGEQFYFYQGGQAYLVWGLGEKKDLKREVLRRALAKVYKVLRGQYKSIGIYMDSLGMSGLESLTGLVGETLLMADYRFDKYRGDKKELEVRVKDVALISGAASVKSKAALEVAKKVASSVNLARDFVNEPPNVLRSDVYAKEIAKDVRTALKGCGVRLKVLGKKELKSEGMELFLSVNAGSAFEPQLVHLTYTPRGVSNKTRHVVLVGKGLVFDTGGYSLKPSAHMANMKYDMAGSATVYAAFRAAALLGVKTKVSCILGITDNAVNARATMPDSIFRGRNGKTVEILNTDAEGRLVLADCLDYACEQKPDFLIDAATLTGACLVALGHEICGLMGNDQSLVDKLLKSAQAQDEYMWQLPIVEEFGQDMKSKIADLKNIGGKNFGGASKAAAFLQEFVREGVAWAHLDIAGIADNQSHLPYCSQQGASGMIVRSLVDFIRNA